MRRTWGKSAPFASTDNVFNGCRRADEKGRKNAGDGIEPTVGTSKSRQSSERSSTLMKTLSEEKYLINRKSGEILRNHRVNFGHLSLPSKFLMSLHCVNFLHLSAKVIIMGGNKQVARSSAKLMNVSGSL